MSKHNATFKSEDAAVSGQLNGKVALITGADRNLGKAMAFSLLRGGACVVMTAMYGSFLPQVVEESGAADRILALEGDISKDDDRQDIVRKSVERFGRVDILVNNAAVTPETFWPSFLVDGEPRQWSLDVKFYRNFLEIDTVAPHAFMAAVVPAMLERGWGRVINIATSLEVMLQFWPYGSAKAALEAQTAVLAKQLEGSGVTANVLSPGAFVKPAPIPLPNGDIIHPDYGPVIMEAPILWLASENSNGVNGKRITAARWKRSYGEGADSNAISSIGWHGVETTLNSA